MASLAPFKTFIAPATKIVARLRGSLTYNNVPMHRSNTPLTWATSPYFAPKLVSDPEQREQ